jgi:glycosyltransferase 2 family protein
LVDSPQHPRRRALYLSILQATVSVVLVAIALATFQWEALAQAIGRLSLAACGIASILVLLSAVLTGARWYALAHRVVPGTLYWHLDHYFRATLLNAVTPANIGGDVYRLVLLGRQPAGTIPVALLLLQERYIGLMSFCAMYLLAFAAITALDLELLEGNAPILVPFAVFAAIAVAAMAVAPWIFRWLSRLTGGRIARYLATTAKLMLEVASFRSAAHFCLLLGLSLLSLLMWVFAILAVSDAVGVALWLPVAAAVAVAVELARWIPISIQGIGVRESLYAWLLASLAGVPAEAGFVIGATVYITLSATTVILGGAFAALAGIRAFLSSAESGSRKTGA